MQEYDYVFRPLKMGQMELSNRLFFDDTTRCRVELPSRTPTPLMAEYYAQRATAGLILTEPTMVMAGHSAFFYEPGLFADSQLQGWRWVAKGVHEKGGRIFAVLDHGGRCCHSINEGSAPMAPSAQAEVGNIPAHYNRTRQTIRYETPRSMSVVDVVAVTESFAKAARLAVEAGLDGVEVLASGGHLLHQFLNPSVNTRTDGYGKDVGGRSKVLLDTVASIGAAIGFHRVGVRLEPPSTPQHGSEDFMPYTCGKLQEMDVAFLHLAHGPTWGGTVFDARRFFKGPIVASGPPMTFNMAEAAIAGRRIDAVAVGRHYGANPDLMARLKGNAPLNDVRQEFLFTRGAEGYVDYPTLAEEEN